MHFWMRGLKGSDVLHACHGEREREHERHVKSSNVLPLSRDEIVFHFSSLHVDRLLICMHVCTHYLAESLSWYSLDLEKHSCTPPSVHSRCMPASSSSEKGSVSSMRETTSITILASLCNQTNHNLVLNCEIHSLLFKSKYQRQGRKLPAYQVCVCVKYLWKMAKVECRVVTTSSNIYR